MTLRLAAAIFGALAASVSAQDCVPLLDAAKQVGASGLYDFAFSALQKLESAGPGWPITEERQPTTFYELVESEARNDFILDFTVTEKFPEHKRRTYFLPSDAAFEAIHPELSRWTLADRLINVFAHGVQKLTAADMATEVKEAYPEAYRPVPGIIGAAPYITSKHGNLLITPGEDGYPQDYSDVKAKIIKADIETCVGPVHVIDAVLVSLACQDGLCDVDSDSGGYGDEDAGAYGKDDMSKGEDKGEEKEMMKEHVHDGHVVAGGKGPDGKEHYEADKASPEVVKKTAGTEVVKDSSASAGSSNSPSGSTGSSGSPSSGSSGSSSSPSSGSSSGGGLSGAAVGGIAAGAAAVGVAAIAAGVFMKGKFAAGAAASSAALSV